MSLRKFTQSVDGTIPIQALMYNDEELISTQDGVGIYDGLQKSPDHPSGTVHVTNQRLFYIDATKRASRSFFLELSRVSRTDYYAGLFTSSSKVTLHLSTENSAPEEPSQSGFKSWECEVCAYRNPPGLSPSASRICGLCGVPRSLPVTISSSNVPSEVPQSTLASASTSALSQRSRKPSAIACPACTFLNHPSMQTCEICSTTLPKAVGVSTHIEAKSAPATRPTTPGPDDDDSESKMLKLSFRRGGDKPFYTALKRSLKGQAWGVAHPNNGNEGVRSGICECMFSSLTLHSNRFLLKAGIMQVVETNAQHRDTNMSNALQDLEALMVKAKDMVRLAAELNERLTASSTTTANNPYSSSLSVLSSTSTEPEEATFIRSSLSQLGLQMENTPVTLDMMKDEREWMEQLARELANVLQGSEKGTPSIGGMMKERGIIALDEVWGGWNRARGVALIPPSTFLQVIPHLAVFTTPTITSRTLNSGLAVLHTPPYSRAAFAARICGLLALAGPKSTTEIAQEEGMTIGLTTEMLNIVEEDGDVCRDDGQSVIQENKGDILVLGEVDWWANLFSGYTWDGQE
ncbi:EAP30/Vps36 family-domain-containing protein [Lentinula aciculospora]|uniref:Vacuolar protein-sorting-associated protein 36 n=1 Tax=Lentinula aciculospora TaxID=153920 RepID=A0A9W9ADA8_9AGAR|nr:EAP30/Vps36 family-domain-containing protein [Lentinula aciculospora]